MVNAVNSDKCDEISDDKIFGTKFFKNLQDRINVGQYKNSVCSQKKEFLRLSVFYIVDAVHKPCQISHKP